ncbi:hypothetical protein vseg_004811 [Gypsophila vaccaria]
MARKKKEEIAEDWCFVCKEGGILLLCEHKECLKAYHPKCVGKDDSFLNSEESWRCNWHSCFICKKAAKFHCLCCPNAICGQCLPDAEFIVVRGIKGFCNNCLNLALLWEEKRNVDADGRKVDFTERETYEFLFMEYWEIIKKNEGLCLEHLQKANASLTKGKNSKLVDNVDEIATCDIDMLNLTNYEDWEWEALEDYVPSREEKKRKSNAFKKGGQCKTQPKKRNSSKKEFLGWGSKALIEFLASLDIDTSVELSPYDVFATVTKYIDEKKLLHPQRKKMIVCDQRLSSILGRKVVNKHKVYNLLEGHYANNHETSEDNIGSTSDQLEARAIKSCSKKRKRAGDEAKIKKKVIAKGSMASIISENIKLAFLRRSLVEELLKQPETFEDKVIGSFMRVKSDPYDYTQHFSHQLVQVTGMRKSPTKESDAEILFQVSSMLVDISLNMISENDFTKEECDQLNQKIKNGAHKKLTVEELELKAKELHGNITTHWIPKELVWLKNAIDNANETGQRRKYPFWN